MGPDWYNRHVPMPDRPSPSESKAATVQPWLLVPVLYFMQAVPVTVVQEVSTIFYRDLGIANEPITRWTSLLALPWALQLLFGPLVDLNGRKRQWILNGQLLIAIGLAATALLLRLPNPFEITLLILGATAVTSALCNIATDGFYIMAMSREQQASFVGVQTTCYRLGRLFCVGVLVFLVGFISHPPKIPVRTQAGQYLAFEKDGKTTYLSDTTLTIRQGVLANEAGKLVPEVAMPFGTYGLSVSAEGIVPTTVQGVQKAVPVQVSTPPSVAGSKVDGPIVSGSPLTSFRAQIAGPIEPQMGLHPMVAWSMVLLMAAGIYAFGHFLNRATLPHPAEDVPVADAPKGETSRNVLRTLNLVAMGIAGYFFINAALRLFLNWFGPVLQGMTGFDPHGWILKPDNAIIIGTYHLSFGATGTEWFQLAVCSAVLGGSIYGTRRLIRGTPMAEALVSYIRQPGFPAILGFILFYRFGEAMVTKMSTLFLKDAVVNGGLAISNEQLGIVKGVIGILGIILGGLVGGKVIAKFGLRRAFLPVAIVMHLPNLLYAYAAHMGAKLPLGMVVLPGLGEVPMTVAGIDFVEQFGYGFGFAAYMVYLMWVAQRGSFKTTHYAIGTGMGALCIATAGAVSGVLQKNFGYAGFFLWAVALGIPGVISLFFIPHDEPT